MKKLITIILVLSMFTLASCGKKEEILEEVPPVESSVSEASIPEAEEPEEEPAPSPIDFMIDNEVNVEEIINHAHQLGLLEETWQEPSEINVPNLLTAFVKENNVSENISEAEFEELIFIFVDISVDMLHESELYNVETKEYVNEPLETTDEEEEQVLKASEVSVVSENIYEITLIDGTDENNPIDFGTLTVENNENIPKYLSFIKPVIVPETPAPVSVAPVVPTTPASNNNSENSTSNIGSISSGGGTGSGNHTGLGSAWDGVDLPPGDPNISDAIGTGHGDAGWK